MFIFKTKKELIPKTSWHACAIIIYEITIVWFWNTFFAFLTFLLFLPVLRMLFCFLWWFSVFCLISPSLFLTYVFVFCFVFVIKHLFFVCCFFSFFFLISGCWDTSSSTTQWLLNERFCLPLSPSPSLPEKNVLDAREEPQVSCSSKMHNTFLSSGSLFFFIPSVLFFLYIFFLGASQTLWNSARTTKT